MQDRGIVFDFDGVILDTETPLYESWEAMFVRYGTHLEMETFARYIGGAEYFDFHALLERGVYIAPSQFEAGFVSTAHTDADIDATIERVRQALAQVG